MNLRDEIEASIRRVQAAQDRLTCAEIDWSCTRSELDRCEMIKSREECEDEVNKAVDFILAVIANNRPPLQTKGGRPGAWVWPP